VQKQTHSLPPFPGIQHFILWKRRTTSINAELVIICNGFSKSPKKIPAIRNSIWNEVYEFLTKDEADRTCRHEHTHTFTTRDWFQVAPCSMLTSHRKVKCGHMFLGFDLQNATVGNYDHVTSLLTYWATHELHTAQSLLRIYQTFRCTLCNFTVRYRLPKNPPNALP
jgi:hypothetical protein